jgi:hypothetical protein
MECKSLLVSLTGRLKIWFCVRGIRCRRLTPGPPSWTSNKLVGIRDHEQSQQQHCNGVNGLIRVKGMTTKTKLENYSKNYFNKKNFKKKFQKISKKNFKKFQNIISKKLFQKNYFKKLFQKIIFKQYRCFSKFSLFYSNPEKFLKPRTVINRTSRSGESNHRFLSQAMEFVCKSCNDIFCISD